MDGAGARPEFSNSIHHLDALPNPIENKWGFIVVFIVVTVKIQWNRLQILNND